MHRLILRNKIINTVHGVTVTGIRMLLTQTGAHLPELKPTFTTIPGDLLGDGTVVIAHIGV